MSTHAALVYIDDFNVAHAIYVHFDGYLNGVGRSLYEGHNTKAQAIALIKGGDISSFNEQHVPRFYNEATSRARTYDMDKMSMDGLIEDLRTYLGADYIYVWLSQDTNPQWMSLRPYENIWRPL